MAHSTHGTMMVQRSFSSAVHAPLLQTLPGEARSTLQETTSLTDAHVTHKTPLICPAQIDQQQRHWLIQRSW
eukprot:2376506-Amphidinium_carterae.2